MSRQPLDAKLLPEPPLLVLRSLAVVVGLNEAIVLQQIHFHSRQRSDRWWRAGMGELRHEFPFWSEATIKRTLGRLRKKGLVEGHQAASTDRTNRYRVDYQRLNRTLGLRDGSG